MKGTRIISFYALALIVLILDQVSKYAIKTNIELGHVVSVIGNFFVLTSHRNRGAAFSILQDQRWLFVLVTSIVLIGIVVFLRKSVASGAKLLPVALSLLLGGAIGNFVDRLFYGEVVDFLQFNFVFTIFGKHIEYTYAVFNVADSGIVVGVILILLDSVLKWRNEKKEGLAHDEGQTDGQGVDGQGAEGQNVDK